MFHGGKAARVLKGPSLRPGRSLERLSKEPELLRADQDQLRRQAQVCVLHPFDP